MVTAEGPEGDLVRRHLDQVKDRIPVQDLKKVPGADIAVPGATSTDTAADATSGLR